MSRLGLRQDAAADGDLAGVEWDGGLLELERDVDDVAKRIDIHQKREHRRLVGISLTEDVLIGPAIRDFRTANIKLIRSLAEDVRGQLEPILAEAERTGLRVEDLADQIEERFDVARSRAELIARDQTLKLNGQLTKLRQQGAGITEYEWSTSRDARVRESHEALDGKRFDWDSPPEVGHPGEDFQCRCVAIPVLPS